MKCEWCPLRAEVRLLDDGLVMVTLCRACAREAWRKRNVTRGMVWWLL